jgi:hypothetical protein
MTIRNENLNMRSDSSEGMRNSVERTIYIYAIGNCITVILLSVIIYYGSSRIRVIKG